ncbi:MAG TPA: hypothetical protein VGO78_07880 [Acidimicrobiales bacterium]|nr:hypothetical protein [Acidimicrobiales bacterium]
MAEAEAEALSGDRAIAPPAARPGGSTVWPVLVAGVAAVAPIVVAGLRAVHRGWVPTGDDAYSAVRAWDVGSKHPPLLATWSSASVYSGRQINHPGALQFDLLAPFVHVLGHGAGTAVGVATINAVSVAALGWLAYRRLGPPGATLALAGSALLSWSMGSELLYDPWSQHAPLIPFSLFLVAVWCLVAGDPVAAPVLVVAGSYALETHLSYSVVVPGLTVVALVVVGTRLVRRRRSAPVAWPPLRRRVVRWAAATGGLAALCWAQPLVDQLTAPGEGNVAGLLRSADVSVPRPGPAMALRAFGGTVAVPPLWLAPSFGSPSFGLSGDGRPTWLAGLGLVALTGALVVLGVRAGRRGAWPVAAGCLTAVAALVLGFLTILRMPIRMGMVPTYLRFVWPLGMVVWVALAVAALDELRASSARLPARALVAPGLVLAAVAGIAALPTVDNHSASPSWTVAAVHGVEDEAVDELQGEGPVLVEMQTGLAVGATGPALFSVLQEAGIPFLVDEPPLVRQLGTSRRYHPGDARVRLVVKGGVDATAWPGERLIAAWHPLTARQEARCRVLHDELVDLVAEHGVPLTPTGRYAVDVLDLDAVAATIAVARDHPEPVVDADVLGLLWNGVPAALAGHRLIDTDVLPADLLDEWTDLAKRHDEEPISLYVAPIRAGA